jgi:[pyruvate, water dikinase]-phosphate phosphotransferase / [pyruvate, water dikinase] kinase
LATVVHVGQRQNNTTVVKGKRPIVFTTLVYMNVLKVIQDDCQGMLLDMFVQPLEKAPVVKSNHRVGSFSDTSKNKAFRDRIEAVNFSL